MLEVGDRRSAIRAAVDAVWEQGAAATVAVVGKGHESGQDVGGVVHPFDDRAELAAGAAPRRRGGFRVIALSLTEVARVTGGSLAVPPGVDPESVVVDGPVVTDSRESGPGGLFVARSGEHADGHDFVPAAVERGAVAALVTRPVEGVPCVVVADTQDAFAALAREVVRRLPGMAVVGITGSSGKTSTKDLLGTVLATAGPTVAPVGSYNSEVGVPLTVCRVAEDTRFLVVEMGARGIGHVDYLARMAPPQVGVVLNVGTAHVGEFGSREAIATAKSELVAALPTDGLAVLNADDPAVRAMASVTTRTRRARRRGRRRRRPRHRRLARRRRPGLVHRAHPAGQPRRAPRARRAPPRRQRAGRWSRSRPSSACRSSRPAPHWSPRDPSAGGGWRSSSAPTASPSSTTPTTPTPTRCAPPSRALERMGEGRRTWAVLGTMLELGDESDALHAEVGAEVVARGVDELVVVGAGRRATGGRAHARRARHPGSAAPASGRCPTPTPPPALLERGARPGRRGAVQVEPRRRATVAR